MTTTRIACTAWGIALAVAAWLSMVASGAGADRGYQAPLLALALIATLAALEGIARTTHEAASGLFWWLLGGIAAAVIVLRIVAPG